MNICSKAKQSSDRGSRQAPHSRSHPQDLQPKMVCKTSSWPKGKILWKMERMCMGFKKPEQYMSQGQLSSMIDQLFNFKIGHELLTLVDALFRLQLDTHK